MFTFSHSLEVFPSLFYLLQRGIRPLLGNYNFISFGSDVCLLIYTDLLLAPYFIVFDLLELSKVFILPLSNLLMLLSDVLFFMVLCIKIYGSSSLVLIECFL